MVLTWGGQKPTNRPGDLHIQKRRKNINCERTHRKLSGFDLVKGLKKSGKTESDANVPGPGTSKRLLEQIRGNGNHSTKKKKEKKCLELELISPKDEKPLMM